MNVVSYNLRTVNGMMKYASDFLKETYDIHLDIPIVINGRLSRTMGAMVEVYNALTQEYEPQYIEMAKRLIEFGHIDSIENTLRHELIHYALRRLGKPYNDGDLYFENELEKYAPRDLEKTFVGKRYKCQCSKCKKTFLDKTKNQKKYITKCCKAEINVIAEIIGNGFEIVEEKPIRVKKVAKSY